ncbi:MAG: DUF2927 domain-containing protein [Candidatus Marinimicrobia bacterium]|nr:DUF2927 domain-containing protein [Candidatus Neomarinimicrobiota bacterium]
MKTIFIAFTFLILGCSFRSNSNNFTQEEIEYFTEIALGAEFGDEAPVIKKWTENIRIKIGGEPTEQDLQTINNIVSDLNELIAGIKIKLVDKNENLVIVFSPESEFSTIDLNYVPTNYGFFWALWHDDNFVIYDASILISSAEITQQERSHLIREELTQSLGLMNDSNKYKDSIFYQEWTDVIEFSEIDRAVIKLLYLKKVKPGMSKEDVLKILN